MYDIIEHGDKDTFVSIINQKTEDEGWCLKGDPFTMNNLYCQAIHKYEVEGDIGEIEVREDPESDELLEKEKERVGYNREKTDDIIKGLRERLQQVTWKESDWGCSLGALIDEYDRGRQSVSSGGYCEDTKSASEEYNDSTFDQNYPSPEHNDTVICSCGNTAKKIEDLHGDGHGVCYKCIHHGKRDLTKFWREK